MKARNLEPTIVTYGTLMTACERVGDVDGARKSLSIYERCRDENRMKIIYGAAISWVRVI